MATEEKELFTVVELMTKELSHLQIMRGVFKLGMHGFAGSV